MLFTGTDPESYITDYTLVYAEKIDRCTPVRGCSECQCGYNYFAGLSSASEKGSYVRLKDVCITQL